MSNLTRWKPLYNIFICISEDEIQGKRIPTRGLGPKGKHLHELPMKIKFLAEIFFSWIISWSSSFISFSFFILNVVAVPSFWMFCSFILHALFQMMIWRVQWTICLMHWRQDQHSTRPAGREIQDLKVRYCHTDLVQGRETYLIKPFECF